MKRSTACGVAAVALSTVLLVAVGVQSRPGATPHPPAQPIVPIPVPNPGGTYGGPGDTVPFGGGPNPNCVNNNCTPPASRCGMGVSCPVTWTPNIDPHCFNCVCDTDLHPINSFSVTFDSMLQLCNSGCVDANGDITIRHDFYNVCDAQVFESRLLIFAGFNNYPAMPPGGSVVVRPCVNGSCTPFGCGQLGPACRTSVPTTCLGCNDVSISLTFNAACMCNALNAWITTLSAQGIPYASYSNFWLLNITATTCQICE